MLSLTVKRLKAILDILIQIFYLLSLHVLPVFWLEVESLCNEIQQSFKDWLKKIVYSCHKFFLLISYP